MNFTLKKLLILIIAAVNTASPGQDNRLRDYGINIDIFETGQYNAITDVPGVKVGHLTLKCSKQQLKQWLKAHL